MSSLPLLLVSLLLLGASLSNANPPPPTQNAWFSPNSNLRRSFSEPQLNSSQPAMTFRRNPPPQRQASWEARRPNWNSNRRDNAHCSTNYKFDYVQLTLQWAPGACSTSPQECRKIENKHFTVHGMWPTKRGTREPANCCFDNTFNFEALKPILNELDDYWYSYFDSSSRGFWSHEWLKHGTCSRDINQLVGEAKYFGTTLKLAKSLNILPTLAKAGIVPNKDDKPYSSDQIVKILTSSLSNNKAIQIDCDYEHNQPIPVLTGLNFCFDSNLEPADCPEMKTKCKRQLLFRS